jgi:hypothetical protein
VVQIFVAITDKDWGDSLSALRPDEVNFWQPGGGQQDAPRPPDMLLRLFRSATIASRRARSASLTLTMTSFAAIAAIANLSGAAADVLTHALSPG